MTFSKQNLHDYLKQDMSFYYKQSRWERFMCWFTQDPVYFIAKYIRFLRKEEYYYNFRQDKVGKLGYLLYFRKKNRLGNKIGFKIPKNCIGPGLTIYHHGEIIINETAVVGANCRLHGGNCIGNNGVIDVSPRIGDNLDVGIGAKIIGDIELGNHVTIGANAVVTRSFPEDGIILLGIPADKKKCLRGDEK